MFVPVEVVIHIEAAKSRIITPDGKQLPIDEVWKRLKADSVVIFSTDGNTPGEAFLRALNANTLIIISPRPDFVPPPPPIKELPLEKKKT